MSEEKTTVTTEKTETVAAPVTTDAAQAKDVVTAEETVTLTEVKDD
jgi:hypothetical protein